MSCGGHLGDAGYLEHREVMAGFRLELEGHVLVVLGHNLAPEAPGFPGEALPPLLVGQPPLVLLLAVPAQADLPHNALKQLLHIVLHGRRGLNELAVEHHRAGSPFWKRRRGKGSQRGRRVQSYTTWPRWRTRLQNCTRVTSGSRLLYRRREAEGHTASLIS